MPKTLTEKKQYITGGSLQILILLLSEPQK